MSKKPKPATPGERVQMRLVDATLAEVRADLDWSREAATINRAIMRVDREGRRALRDARMEASIAVDLVAAKLRSRATFTFPCRDPLHPEVEDIVYRELREAAGKLVDLAAELRQSASR